VGRHTIDDVVEAAGRLFGERGFHGTSMRDLGAELGLLGSSLYSHIGSKQELLIAVIEKGSRFFEAAADAAEGTPGSGADRVAAFVGGHLDVVLDHRDEVRTFLNEARFLEPEERAGAVALRDRYEERLRALLREGIEDGSFSADLDVPLASISILSILNTVERWHRDDGRLDRAGLAEALTTRVLALLQ
jgi:AcrR family transcriptional regulator